MALDIKRILNEMIARGASDLHLKVASPPVLRVNGILVYMELPAPSVQEMVAVAQQILTPAQRELFEATREIDFAFGVPGVARFRANFYVQRGSIAMVFRHVPVQIKNLDDLELPPVVRDLAMKPRGLILVTGTVGSGKSTTLATMVDIINTDRSSHVITIEDPIEFLHRDKRSIVSQREVGADTGSYAEALKHILRQDPDVILIGEIRDADSMKIALTAADTGHLVLSTLHTTTPRRPSAASSRSSRRTSTRRSAICWPPRCRPSSRSGWCANPTGERRYPAVEIMIATSTIREFIRDPEKTILIRQAIQEGFVQYQMQTFDQSLMQLVKEDRINVDSALQASSNPHEFLLRLKGIQASSDTTWDRFEQNAAPPQPVGKDA